MVARQDEGWWVDDRYCAGHPKTSIYEPRTASCPSGSGSSVATSTPQLSFACGVPSSNAVVTCQLTRYGFFPHENVFIAYQVSVSTPQGGHVRTVYRRTALIDGKGFFTRPPFSFRVDPRVLAYEVTAVVTGARGDRGEITAAGTP